MSDRGSWFDRERDRTRNHAVVSFTRSEYAAMLDVIEAADAACRQTSTKGAYLALNDVEAALARFHDAADTKDGT